MQYSNLAEADLAVSALNGYNWQGHVLGKFGGANFLGYQKIFSRNFWIFGNFIFSEFLGFLHFYFSIF